MDPGDRRKTMMMAFLMLSLWPCMRRRGRQAGEAKECVVMVMGVVVHWWLMRE
jgi:hypothetical protein